MKEIHTICVRVQKKKSILLKQNKEKHEIWDSDSYVRLKWPSENKWMWANPIQWGWTMNYNTWQLDYCKLHCKWWWENVLYAVLITKKIYMTLHLNDFDDSSKVQWHTRCYKLIFVQVSKRLSLVNWFMQFYLWCEYHWRRKTQIINLKSFKKDGHTDISIAIFYYTRFISKWQYVTWCILFTMIKANLIQIFSI